jgi:tetratricopeptide (TPR) repeat protein
MPVAVPRAAYADSAGVDEGRTRFARGIDLYKEGNFHAALAEFRAAYAAAPSFRIQYNLGQTLFQVEDYANAQRAFEQYLSEGGDKIDAERRKEVEADLAKLRPRVAQMTISVNIAGADVTVDDEPRGKLPKRGMLVNEGRRKIVVTASGYQTETRVVDVAGTQRVGLNFELKPMGGELAGATGGTDGTRSRSRTPFYVGLVATGVLGAGTGALAIVAASKQSAYDRALNVPNHAQAIASARSATHTTALVADVVGGAAIAAGAFTLLAFVLTSGSGEPRGASTNTAAHLLIGPTSAGLAGNF